MTTAFIRSQLQFLHLVLRAKKLLFKIFVQTPADKNIALEVHPDNSIDSVKKHLQDLIPLHRQSLVFAGRQLEDGKHPELL